MRLNSVSAVCGFRPGGLRPVRVHDPLRHTFASRLRAAGVSEEDRAVLLGHSSHTMAGHYASAAVGRLLQAANRILARSETCTVLRVGNGTAFQEGRSVWINGPTGVPQKQGGLGFAYPSPLKDGAPGRIRTHDPLVRSVLDFRFSSYYQ